MRVIRYLAGLAVAAQLAACAGSAAPGEATAPAQSAPASPAAQSAPAPPSPAPAELSVRFADAASVGLAAAPDGPLYVVLGVGGALSVARSDDGGASFGRPVVASGTTHPLISRFERPTIAAGSGGAVAVSWLEQQQGGRTLIWLARSDDGGASFGPPEQLAASTAFETTMVRLAAGADVPTASWLQGGSLQLVRPAAAATTVDELVCECCQPAALADGGRLLLAYRNLERAAAGDVRDLFVAVSADGGGSFAAPVRVSDQPWQINACPISGPALAAGAGQIYVAWMDGRADTDATGLRGDIFVAVSADEGRSFGPNRRVNPTSAGYHNLPALGVDRAGRLHIAWEADEDEGYSLYYSVSADGGASFAAPRRLADDAQGRPANAALVVGSTGNIHIAWLDRDGVLVRTLPASAGAAAS